MMIQKVIIFYLCTVHAPLQEEEREGEGERGEGGRGREGERGRKREIER